MKPLILNCNIQRKKEKNFTTDIHSYGLYLTMTSIILFFVNKLEPPKIINRFIPVTMIDDKKRIHPTKFGC